MSSLATALLFILSNLPAEEAAAAGVITSVKTIYGEVSGTLPAEDQAAIDAQLAILEPQLDADLDQLELDTSPKV
jgi:hypothetical protein